MDPYFLMTAFALLLYSSLYISFHMHSTLTDVMHGSGSHTSAVKDENFLKQTIMPRNDCKHFFVLGPFLSVLKACVDQVSILS